MVSLLPGVVVELSEAQVPVAEVVLDEAGPVSVPLEVESVARVVLVMRVVLVTVEVESVVLEDDTGPVSVPLVELSVPVE